MYDPMLTGFSGGGGVSEGYFSLGVGVGVVSKHIFGNFTTM